MSCLQSNNCSSSVKRGKFYQEVADGHIEVVKMGTATLVLTQPEDYIAALKKRYPQRHDDRPEATQAEAA